MWLVACGLTSQTFSCGIKRCSLSGGRPVCILLWLPMDATMVAAMAAVLAAAMAAAMAWPPLWPQVWLPLWLLGPLWARPAMGLPRYGMSDTLACSATLACVPLTALPLTAWPLTACPWGQL